MRDNNMKYGFNMNILDDARSFPSLWSRTRSFINAHPELIHPEADLDWLLDPQNSGDYNNCQFFSNFEVGNLNYFRGEANEKYFDWLDRGGGFYYERFGDAPIHTLSVAMFVPKSEIWFFRDIGYQHDINRYVHLSSISYAELIRSCFSKALSAPIVPSLLLRAYIYRRKLLQAGPAGITTEEARRYMHPPVPGW